LIGFVPRVALAVKHPEDDRLPWAVAMQWVARLTTISLEMALPGLGGFWLDQWLGTRVVFLIVGVIVGFAAGMWHLVQLTKPIKPRRD
jgi:hypothetical protein